MRARSTERSQSNLPDSRSKHCVKSLALSKPVRKMCRRVRTGEDLPGRTGVRQSRFLFLLNSVGNPVPVETPEPFGPRNRVHSCAVPAGAERRNTDKRQFKAFVMDAPERPHSISTGAGAASGGCHNETILPRPAILFVEW